MLFIYRGRRTGGTAVMDAFTRAPGVSTFYDGLHPHLAHPWSAIRDHSGDAWPSGHPEGMRYHAAFEPLVRDDRIAGFEERFIDIHALDDQAVDNGLRSWFEALIAIGEQRHEPVVIGLEMGEFLLPWLRRTFPSATHVGIDRSPSETLTSWVFQWAMGNPWFVNDGVERVRRDPATYGHEAVPADESLSVADRIAIARSFIETTNAIRAAECDAAIRMDLLPEPTAITDARTAAPLPGRTWDAVAERLARSRPVRDTVSQLNDVLEHEQATANHLQGLTEHSHALEQVNANLQSRNAALDEALDDARYELDLAHRHNRELADRVTELEPYTYRPSLALGVARRNLAKAVTTRLRGGAS